MYENWEQPLMSRWEGRNWELLAQRDPTEVFVENSNFLYEEQQTTNTLHILIKSTVVVKYNLKEEVNILMIRIITAMTIRYKW